VKIDVILDADGQVVGVHADGCGAYFVVEEPYVHSMPMDSGWRVRRYTAETGVPRALLARLTQESQETEEGYS
jgi:hypothetical protein